MEAYRIIESDFGHKLLKTCDVLIPILKEGKISEEEFSKMFFALMTDPFRNLEKETQEELLTFLKIAREIETLSGAQISVSMLIIEGIVRNDELKEMSSILLDRFQDIETVEIHEIANWYELKTTLKDNNKILFVF